MPHTLKAAAQAAWAVARALVLGLIGQPEGGLEGPARRAARRQARRVREAAPTSGRRALGTVLREALLAIIAQPSGEAPRSAASRRKPRR